VGYITYGINQFVELANAPGARKRAASLTARALRADLANVNVTLTLDVEAALIDLVAARRRQTLLERATTLLDSVAKIVSDRVAAGANPRYDAARFRITQATIHADLAEAQADVARAWAELRAAVGPEAARLSGEPEYPLESGPTLPEPAALLAMLERARPDLEAARQRAASASATISATRRSVWPGVGVTVAGGYGAARQQVDVGVGLSVPLPVVDHGQGTVTAARARAAEANAYVDAVRIPASARIDGMYAEVVTRRHALTQYTDSAVTTGDEMLTEAQAGYLAGRFSVLELADAYAAWRDARLRVIALAAAARNAEVDLGRQVGQPLRGL
jgi:outer membrane protein TolC